MKSVALFDFDNTLYDGFSYFDLLQKQTTEGLVAPDVLPAADEVMKIYKNGTIVYEQAIVNLLDIYAQGLKGQSYGAIYDSTHEFYRESQKVYRFAPRVFDMLRSTHDICLVTGEPQFIAGSIADIYGLDSYYSTQYEVVGDVFTGGITSYLATRHEKHGAVEHLLRGHQIGGSFAFGDSEGDIGMLAAVENPICINPNQGLRERAAQNGWPCAQPGQVEEVVSGLLAQKFES